MPPYDVVLRNGLVANGTGSAMYPADVGIADDRVAAVGGTVQTGAIEIDATGCIVAPGFIDVHSHDDFALLMEPRLPFKVMQGVTTVVVGNCGTGVVPFDVGLQRFRRYYPGASPPRWHTYSEYLDVLERTGPGLNVGVLAGHGSLRRGLVGEQRQLSARDLERMCRQVDEALRDGCLGLSTGLAYAPGAFAESHEIESVCSVVADADAIYASHIRNEASGLREAIGEFIQVSRATGVRGQISHLKSSGNQPADAIAGAIELVDTARAEGLDITADAYPYAASSTELSALKINDTLAPQSAGAFGHVAPQQIVVASAPGYEGYEGRSLHDISNSLDMSPTGAVDELLGLMGEACFVVLHAMKMADVEDVLVHPAVMVGSDGLPSVGSRPHPRLFGTFPRFLRHLVVDGGKLDWATAVHKMTGLPAAKYGLRDRGWIGQGAFGDLVVLRPEAVADEATFEDPRRYPSGIEWVLINGRVAVRGGHLTGGRDGRVLRRPA